MGFWPSTRAAQVLAALKRNGWREIRQEGSHKTLLHPDRGEYTWAFRDSEEIGPKMLAKIAKKTGLRREDL